LFNIIFQLHAQRPVVPAVGQATINLGSGKNKTTALAQTHNLFHQILIFRHKIKLLFLYMILPYLGNNRKLLPYGFFPSNSNRILDYALWLNEWLKVLHWQRDDGGRIWYGLNTSNNHRCCLL